MAFNPLLPRNWKVSRCFWILSVPSVGCEGTSCLHEISPWGRVEDAAHSLGGGRHCERVLSAHYLPGLVLSAVLVSPHLILIKKNAWGRYDTHISEQDTEP